MSYAKMRVEIPNNPSDLLDLAKKINTKHLSDGNLSPLNSIETNNWAIEGPNITLCLKNHLEAEQFRAKMEEAYKERDLLLTGINCAVRATRNVLSGVHHDNMKRLSDWGFTVNESAKSGPKRPVLNRDK